MTNAEAIEILKERRMCAAFVDSEYVGGVDIEAIDIAISALEKQEREKPLTVLPCGDDATPIKCTGLNCPMQVGKVDPATCKAAGTCKWATKPMTKADKIRSMTDEELANPYCGFSYFDKGETNGGELCIVLMCSIINQETNGADYNGNRPSWCPLVPLPEGHGKIIDGDALWENMTVEQSEAFQKGLAGTIELFEMLEAATPIVPAEGVVNDGA